MELIFRFVRDPVDPLISESLAQDIMIQSESVPKSSPAYSLNYPNPPTPSSFILLAHIRITTAILPRDATVCHVQPVYLQQYWWYRCQGELKWRTNRKHHNCPQPLLWQDAQEDLITKSSYSHICFLWTSWRDDEDATRRITWQNYKRKTV